MNKLEVIANLSTKKGKYIGLIKGNLKKDIKGINNLRYKDATFTNFSNINYGNLEDYIEFSYGKIKRDIDKFIGYTLSLDIDGRRFINLKYRFSKRKMKKKSRKCSKESEKILGKRISFYNFFFKNGEKKSLKNEIMSNITRLDDRDFLEYLNITQMTILGGIPIDREKEIKYNGFMKSSNYYFVIKRDAYELKCEIPNFKKRHNLIIPIIDNCIQKKKEIIIGGNYFHKDKRIVVHYLRTDNFRYPLFKKLFQ